MNCQELSNRLLNLSHQFGSYTLTQINGQRIFKKSSHAWVGPEPPRSCEVFIGRIPHDCFEDVLIPIFASAGELFEFRLMINFSGMNRGYAFAMYTTTQGACNAIKLFNNFLIRPNWPLGVCASINNCRIYVSKIPATLTSDQIVRFIYNMTEEVVGIRIRRSGAFCAAIVEYNSHRGAAMARKVLVTTSWGDENNRLNIDWCLPVTAQMLRQYREVGYITKSGAVMVHNSPTPPSTPDKPHVFTLSAQARAERALIIRAAEAEAINNLIRDTQRLAIEYPASSSSREPSPRMDSPQQVQIEDNITFTRLYNPWVQAHPLGLAHDGKLK